MRWIPIAVLALSLAGFTGVSMFDAQAQGIRPTQSRVKSVTPSRINSKLDSKSAIGERQYLRMQMTMDRQSKAHALISNVMKKSSATRSQVIRNMK